MKQSPDKTTRAGQRTGLFIAGLGIFWLCANIAAGYLGWSNKTRFILDLVALAGFGGALLMVLNIWRTRQKDKG